MEAFVGYLQAEWDVVRQVYPTIITIVVIISGLIYRIFQARLSAVKELLEFKTAQLKDIQNRTGTESPEEVAARLSAVEAQLKELGETDFVALFEAGLK